MRLYARAASIVRAVPGPGERLWCAVRRRSSAGRCGLTVCVCAAADSTGRACCFSVSRRRSALSEDQDDELPFIFRQGVDAVDDIRTMFVTDGA